MLLDRVRSVSTWGDLGPSTQHPTLGRLVTPEGCVDTGSVSGNRVGMGIIQRKAKKCARCEKRFIPTGPNSKRCAPCRRPHALESCKARWARTYVKTGYQQAGSKNNAWKGGTSPAYYRRVCFEAHGDVCKRCSSPATLVHHRDGNRSNSEVGNLEPLCKRCHQIEHNCAGNLPAQVRLKLRRCSTCTKRYRPTGPRQERCVRCRGTKV